MYQCACHLSNLRSCGCQDRIVAYVTRGISSEKALARTSWHGTDRGTWRFMAQHGTENLGTARHGKSWHGKIMARHSNELYNHESDQNIWVNKGSSLANPDFANNSGDTDVGFDPYYI